MDLLLNNEIRKSSKTNDEINVFMNELENVLKNEQSKDISSILCDEIYKEIPIASKYTSQLKNIIEECMKNESYQGEFFYVDYDSKKKSYFLNCYDDGELQRTKITKREMDNSNLKIGMFYGRYEESNIVEDESIKEGLKLDIEAELNHLDALNKKGKSKK